MLKKFGSLFKIAQFANKRWNLGAHPVDWLWAHALQSFALLLLQMSCLQGASE